jgi:FSR family fosmidomycin resistance protein-like MFS transporter
VDSASTVALRAPDRRLSATRIALVVAIAHAFNDAYSAFVAPLLPRLMDRMGLSIALAATVAMTYSVASSLLQPFLGYLADRHGRRAFLVAGPLLSGVFVSLIGLADTFWVMIVVLTIAGLGSAAFHPPGASYAARVSEGRGSGVRYSMFSFGGSMGYALGPLIAVGVVHWRGLEGLWVAMVPVLVLAPALYVSLPSPRVERSTVHHPPAPGEIVRQLAGPLGLVFGISALMAWAQRTFLTMVPIIVNEAGGSEALGAVTLTVYLGAQAVGTLTGGYLADRVDRHRLLMALCGLSFPAFLAAVALPPGSGAAIAAAGFAGFLGMATMPPIVVMAQELHPRGVAVSSGIVMGLAWAAGSLGVMGSGVLADFTGPVVAALATMPVVLGAALLARRSAIGRTAPRAA